MKPAFLHLKYSPDGVTAEGDPSYYHGNAVTMDDGSRNGVYAEWDWDGTTLRAGNCRYGMSPLFYYCGDDEICISNSIPKMLDLGVPNDWDDDAMAVFIRRHTFLGEDTPFKHIRATPPGAKLTWRDGRMSLESTRHEPKPQHLKRSAIIDGVIELFQQAIARRLPDTEDFYLPLTGGKDSRHILLELNRQGVRPKACVTARKSSSSDDADCAIAAQLAERLNLPHIILPPSNSIVADEQRKNLRTNFCTLDHGWSLPLVDFLEDNTTLSYDGLGLDVFFETIWLSNQRADFLEQGSYQALAADFLGDSETALSQILDTDALQHFNRAKAMNRLTQELETHAQKPHPIAAFQFWSRTRRTTSTFTFNLQNNIGKIYTPFLDFELFDFVSSFQADRKLAIHLDSMVKAYPNFRNIGYAQTGELRRQNAWQIRRILLGLFPDTLAMLTRKSLIRSISISTRFLKGGLTGSPADYYWLQPWLVNYFAQLENRLSH